MPIQIQVLIAILNFDQLIYIIKTCCSLFIGWGLPSVFLGLVLIGKDPLGVFIDDGFNFKAEDGALTGGRAHLTVRIAPGLLQTNANAGRVSNNGSLKLGSNNGMSKAVGMKPGQVAKPAPTPDGFIPLSPSLLYSVVKQLEKK
jgi:hypothetical protein